MSLKQNVLALLEQSRERNLSGQEIADQFSVSRNAVWKAINSLREEGYDIQSGQNRGYRLAKESDKPSTEGISCLLQSPLEVFCFDQIDSTNKEAKRMLSNGFSKEALLVAAEQTAGRGRLGRSFYSPADTGVYMTVLLHPSAEISTVLNITSAAALAVCLAIEELTDLLPGIKWVNDIYLNRKKVGGILTEAVTDVESGTVQSVLVGIGINVSTTQFPKEIQDRAASIGRPLSRQVLAASICDHLYKMSKNLSDPSIMEQYRARSIMIGQEVDFYIGDEKTSGTVLSIDEQGGLVVETQNGDCKTLRTGEVTLRFKGEAR